MSSGFPLAYFHFHGSAWNVLDFVDGLTIFQTRRQVKQRTLAHAEDDQVCGCIGQNRLSHRIGPIIIMGEPAQACLQSAQDNRYARKERVNPVRINDCSSVRPPKHTTW
ncbi:Uncharacterised protein [uncultured archaeon]|nr:Uncharacterised protein [uncultured archaeon]